MSDNICECGHEKVEHDLDEPAGAGCAHEIYDRNLIEICGCESYRPVPDRPQAEDAGGDARTAFYAMYPQLPDPLPEVVDDPNGNYDSARDLYHGFLTGYTIANRRFIATRTALAELVEALEQYASQPQRYGHEAQGSGLGPEIALAVLDKAREVMADSGK